MTNIQIITRDGAICSKQNQRPAGWVDRPDAPADWHKVARECAARGEFDFAVISAEYARLVARRVAA